MVKNENEKLRYVSPRTVMAQLAGSRLCSSSKDPYYPYGSGIEDYEGGSNYEDNLFD